MTDSDRTGDPLKKIQALEREIDRLKQVQSDLIESEEKYLCHCVAGTKEVYEIHQ